MKKRLINLNESKMKKNLVILLLIMSSTLFSQSRIYVDADATGLNDGTSWANAYTSLTDAIASGSNGDTLWVANGTYKPGVNNTQTFNVNTELKIYGGFVGNETQLNQRDFLNNLTILSGDLAGDDIVSNFPFNPSDVSRDDNSNRIMNVYANNVVLDGLVIRGGHTSIAACSGIYVHSQGVSDFRLKNCEISLNYAFSINAGIMMDIEEPNTYVGITNNRFQYNQSNTGTGIYIFTDAAVTANIEIANNQFLRQRVEANGNYFSGAAGWVRAFSPGSTMNLTFANNTICKSVIANPVSGRVATIFGVSIDDNNTTGGMNSEIVNNIFWDNEDGAGNNPAEISSILNNGTTYGTVLENRPNIAPEQLSVFSGNPGINSDPLFTNAQINDFSLSAASPALNSGNNSFAVGLTDLLGNPRISGTLVDLGAIERPINATNYTITTSSNPSTGGSTTGAGTYADGTIVSIVATPNMGYSFTNWTENGAIVSTNSSYSFSISSNRTLTANFEPIINNYTVTTSSNPSAGGTTSGGGTFASGSNVTITATPNLNYNFVNWTENGSVVSSDISYSFNVNANRDLVANFDPIISVEEIENENINIYPNPTNGFVNIDIENFSSVEVYSATGELIYRSNLNEVDLSKQPSGIYLFKVLTINDSLLIKRVIKN